MDHKGRCVGNRVNAYTSDMDFHGGSKLSKFPAPMVQEILSNTAFRVEMDKMNSEYKSYWLYVDIDYQRNGHKSALFKDSVYSTPHYQVALYVPEVNTLYYLEYSI